MHCDTTLLNIELVPVLEDEGRWDEGEDETSFSQAVAACTGHPHTSIHQRLRWGLKSLCVCSCRPELVYFVSVNYLLLPLVLLSLSAHAARSQNNSHTGLQVADPSSCGPAVGLSVFLPDRLLHQTSVFRPPLCNIPWQQRGLCDDWWVLSDGQVEWKSPWLHVCSAAFRPTRTSLSSRKN